MVERICCICKKEPMVAPVRFPLLKEAYPMGANCHASWRIEAEALGRHLGNPAKVQVAFRQWMGRVAA